MVRTVLIDLNLDELHYYPFITSMNRCDGSCNTMENFLGRIYIFNKIEGVNLKIFNVIKGMNESKALAKRISCQCRCKFDGKKYNSRWKWNNVNCQCKCKMPIRHRPCKRIMRGIIVHVLASVIRVMGLVNILEAVYAWRVLLMRVKIGQWLHQSILMSKKIIGLLMLLY